jgi:CRP-like cAMP-binding protein
LCALRAIRKHDLFSYSRRKLVVLIMRETPTHNSIPDPGQNHFLAALPASDYARLLPDLELIAMPLGWVLRESGAQMNHAYFPTTSIVSNLYVMEDGTTCEISVTGNEGLIGICLFMGSASMTSHAVVISAGSGYRLNASIVKREFAQGGAFYHLALRFTQALIAQTSQTAVCNRHHSLCQQLCRWLLLSLDRLPGNELAITQEQIANMLGVRREGVTEAAGNLQRDGLIIYRRGHITVLDRAKLEQRACECYGVVKKEYDRLLPYPTLHTEDPLHHTNAAATAWPTVNLQTALGHG